MLRLPRRYQSSRKYDKAKGKLQLSYMRTNAEKAEKALSTVRKSPLHDVAFLLKPAPMFRPVVRISILECLFQNEHIALNKNK